VIRRFAGVEIAGLAAFKKALAEAPGEEAPVVFRRDRETLVTMVKLRKEEPPKPGGELAKAWLGVQTQVLTQKVAQAVGLAGRKGFRLTDVYPWTKAHAAGLRPGDVLVAVDGEELKASRPQDAKDLRNLIEEMSIGEEVELTVLREGKEKRVTVELEETPSSATDAKTAASEEFEFKVRELTFMDRVRRKLGQEEKGLLVTEVTAGGWARIAGLGRGHIIKAVAGRSVGDVASFEAAMAAVLAERPKVVQVYIRRGYQTSFLFLEPDWSRLGARKEERDKERKGN
jgi:serine protease Do